MKRISICLATLFGLATAEGQQVVQKTNYNLYIENSESMDGYVEPGSPFETTIFDLLNSLNNANLADTVRLNYINSNVIPVNPHAGDEEIRDFISRISKEDFRKRGGHRQSSEFYEMFDKILGRVDQRNAVVFVSDCLYYPDGMAKGSHYCVDENLLARQQSGMTRVFTRKLATMNMSLIVLEMTATFDGTYFDRCNRRIPMKMERPYYIWIAGSDGAIRSLLDGKVLDYIAGHYRKKVILGRLDAVRSPRYNIARIPLKGKYDVSNGGISNARPVAGGGFGFSLMLDYSKSLQGDDYFTENTVYEISDPNYSCRASPVTVPADKNNGYTHRLELVTDHLKSETPLIINAKAVLPPWVSQVTSVDDAAILTDSREQNKSFGIGYLIRGAFAAYYPPSKPNVLYSTKITINR